MRSMNHENRRPLTYFRIFQCSLGSLNNGTVSRQILGYLVSPLRKANVGHSRQYENDDN